MFQQIFNKSLCLAQIRTGSKEYRVVTSNPGVLKALNLSSSIEKFNSFVDLKPAQILTYDVFNEEFVIIDSNDDIISNDVLGIPFTFNPVLLINDKVQAENKDEVEEKYLYMITPLVKLILELKNRGITDIGARDPAHFVTDMVPTLRKIDKIGVNIPERAIIGAMQLIKISRKLTSDFNKKYEIFNVLPNLTYIFDELKTEFDNNLTLAEFAAKLNNKEYIEILKNAWCDYLEDQKNKIISTNKAKLEQVLANENFSSALLSREELLQQIRDIIASLEKMNTKEEFMPINCLSVSSFFKIWPFFDPPPAELEISTVIISRSNAKLIRMLQENGLDNVEDIYYDQNKNIVKVRNHRLNQIETKKQELINEILSDINQSSADDEKAELNDLINTIKADEGYKQDLENIKEIPQILEYWPAILFPAPSFVVLSGWGF
jgi:hypothetical protein